jgi:peptide/nickel transport system permease protein
MHFLLRRFVFYAVAAWASLTLNFFLPRLMPGDPATAIFGRFRDAPIDPVALESMRQAYGISDDPVFLQYLRYLVNAARGEFGVSISYFPSPVLDVVLSGLVWTVLLGLSSLLISFAIGSVLGIVGAWNREGAVDSLLPPVAMLIGSFPYFWLATLALFFLSFSLQLFPFWHAYDDTLTPGWDPRFLWSVLTHLALPALTIVVVSVGGWLLGMRNTMISVLDEDYITLAEAKGLSQRRIMFAYAARNALLPNVTSFGMALGFVLSGALLTEVVFSYPGLGYQFLIAVQSNDYPLIQGLFLMITFAVLTANLIVDILYVRLDPRVRVS